MSDTLGFYAGLNRRRFLQASGVVALGGALAACGGGGGETEQPTQAAPSGTFTEPTHEALRRPDHPAVEPLRAQPRHVVRQVRQRLGPEVGVNVKVDHIDQAQITTRIAAEISAGQGHDLIQFIAPLSQFEPSVLDLKDVTDEAIKRWGTQLELCRKSSFNPTTGKFYAYSPGWVPDPGNYRKSLWEPVGLAERPDHLGRPAPRRREIKKSKGVQMGLGMSQEIDSNMVLRALMWSLRRLHPGRQRAGRAQLAADRRRGRVHGPAVQGHR